MSPRPQFILRLGSHSEKDYVLKTKGFLDGLIVGANLLEATPGATSSLIINLAGLKEPRVPYYLDPMTYAFGRYVDPAIGAAREDLDWIKSDKKVKDPSGKKKGLTERTIKRSYAKLAEALGGPFNTAAQRDEAIVPTLLSDSGTRRAICDSVIRYQRSRVATELQKDELTRPLADRTPPPAALFVPYFYIEPSLAEDYTRLFLALCASAAERTSVDLPIHAVLCADVSLLQDTRLTSMILDELPNTGVSGVWLWFSKFFEDRAPAPILSSYRTLVERLARSLSVFALHGGYLSLALYRAGLKGISHGVGYGEQKDVVPVIGQSTPTVRYYLPPVHRRLGVPQIERAFDSLGIRTPSDFHNKVCGCVICRGIVADDLKQFSAFGEQRFSRPSSKRLAQTPEAAKRCRFHFLLCRIAEREFIASNETASVAQQLRDAAETWGRQPTISSDASHLNRWADLLV